MKDFAPVLAGTPPAFILAVQLYKSVAQALGITQLGLASVFPGLLALAGMAGMIWVELQTYKTAARAFALREPGPFVLAALGAVTLSGFVVFAVYVGAETKSLATSTIGMIIGYLIIAVNEYMQERTAAESERKAEIHKRQQDQIALLRAQKNLVAAEARRAAVSGGQSQNSTGQERTKRSVRLDPAVLEAVTNYLRRTQNPSAVSLRELERAGLGVKKTAAADYKAAALEAIRENK